ncbi:MAG: HNH endonuclease signature motif containing protein [Acetobacteraceae bacterium]
MPGDRFYQRPAWRRFRAAILQARPICEVPGCDVVSTNVDHIVPRSRGGADYDPVNVQALCASCHSAKTAIRDGGFGRSHRPGAPIRLPGCDVTGMPRDPAHPWRTSSA